MGTNNQYFIGMVTNVLPPVDQPGFAALYEFGKLPARIIYSALNDNHLVHYAPHAQALVLFPLTPASFKALGSAGYYLTGKWLSQQYPTFNPGVNGDIVFLHATSLTEAASATSAFALVENPTFVLTQHLDDAPDPNKVPGAVPRVFTVNFGGHCTLTYGAQRTVQFTYTDKYGASKTIEHYLSDEEAHQFYYAASEFSWFVYCIGGYSYTDQMGRSRSTGVQIRLICSALSQPWIIYDADTVAAAPFTIGATCGSWAFHLMLQVFEASGTFTFPPINIGSSRSDDPHMGIWGPNGMTLSLTETGWTNGASAAMSVSGTGTDKTMALDLLGDRYHTPWVQAAQMFWLPTYTLPSIVWTDITEHVLIGQQPRINRGNNGMATAEITFNNHNGAFTSALSANMKRGQCAIAITEEGQPVFVGIANGRHNPYPINQAETYSLRCASPLAVLGEGSLRSFPCLAGARANIGLSCILQFKGIPPGSIVEDGTFDDTDCLDDPQIDYANLPFNPAMGENAQSFAGSIMERGYRLLDKPVLIGGQPSSEVHIQHDEPDATRKCVFYDRLPGGTADTTIRDITADAEYVNTINKLTVIGQDAEGNAISAQKTSTREVDGDWEYTGQDRERIVVDNNLMSQGSVDKVCDAMWKRRPRPTMRLEIVTTDPNARNLFKGDRIGVQVQDTMASGYNGGLRDYEVDTVDVEHGQVVNTYTIRAEVIHTN